MPVQFENSNTSFSKVNPWLQLAVDSTSLKGYKNCPRYYYYSIILGYQPRSESIHLTFGLLMHGAAERYQHGKSQGKSHEDALDWTLDWLLRQTWNKALGKPWDSGDSYKNRYTAIRTAVWYLDRYGEKDSLETVILANGKPAVELSFSFHSGFSTRTTKEPFFFCGHLDRLATLNGDAYIPDIKTSKSELNARFWNSFNPSTQFGMYLLAGEIVYKQSVKGLIIDGCQVLVNDSRFDRHLITKDQFQMDEYYAGTGRWLSKMEDSAEEAAASSDPISAYEMNEESCSKYNGCDFQSICSRSPGSRQQWLDTGFKKRTWDPLQRRGDI